MSLLGDLIDEYRLIAKNKLVGKDFPDDWKRGEKETVLILQGIHEQPYFLMTIAKELHAMGYGINGVYSQKETEEKIEFLAEKTAQFIIHNRLRKVILVAHSKGGLVAKYMVDTYPEINRLVKKIVTLSSPYQGSFLANLVPGYIQLDYKNTFLEKMGKHSENNHKFLVLYPTFDNHVIPFSSLKLGGAKNIRIPINGHTRILESIETLELLRKEVE